MIKYYNKYRFLILFFITISILLNFILCYNEKNIICIIAFRNLFLYVFLICFLIYNKWTFSLLIFLNLAFWFYFFNDNCSQSYYNNPIIYFTNPLREFLKYASFPQMILKIISIIPLIINILIIFIDIPYRLKYSKKYKQ